MTPEPEERTDSKPAATPGAAASYGSASYDPRRRSPFLAILLSAGPGLGQVYCGYYQRGFVHAIVVATLITLLATGDVGPLIPLLAVFLGFFWIYNMIDAGRRAMLINEALDGRAGIELPQDFELPGFRGSVVGGVVLMLVGAVLLGNTLLDYSLEWVGEWWPAALIGFGAYLVYKARQEAAGPKTPAAEDED